jgi:hypothetical protein
MFGTGHPLLLRGAEDGYQHKGDTFGMSKHADSQQPSMSLRRVYLRETVAVGSPFPLLWNCLVVYAISMLATPR